MMIRTLLVVIAVGWMGCNLAEPPQAAGPQSSSPATEAENEVAESLTADPHFFRCLANSLCVHADECSGTPSTTACGPGGLICCNPTPRDCRGLCVTRREACPNQDGIITDEHCLNGGFCCEPLSLQ